MATKTELEIEQLQTALAALEAKKTTEDIARAADSARVRALAVALHQLLCPLEHNPLACTWQRDQDYDNPTTCDWTEPQHIVWLSRARHGIAKMVELGFTVTDPA
jgi:hypothetical protein